MTPKELSLLKGRELTNAFITYFKSWTLTSSCLEIIKEIATKVIEAKYVNDDLIIVFKSNDGEEVSITFGTAYNGNFLDTPFTIPASYKTVVQMHNTITFGDGVPDYIGFYGYDGEEPSSEFMLDELEGNEEIHQGFCDAGQNWIIWNHQRKNALGEPVFIIADHGLTVDDNDDFPEQDKVAFGIGGLFIRLMKEFIFDDTDYGWG